MKVMHAIRKMLGRDDPACDEDACREERLKEADRRLHEQATRLHVLEWEAYGGRQRTRTEKGSE